MGNKGNGKFHHSKRLGQNFLRDYEVVDNIVFGSNVGDRTLVIEIGPGEGVLTSALAEEACAVIAVEIDDRLIPILKQRFVAYNNVEILHADILKVDINEVIEDARSRYDFDEVRVVGNLPYYITTPIIMKLLEDDLDIESVTAMMQKEVADRLLAEPGTKKAGAITYSVNYYCETSLICDVGKECFYPVPKVDSAVVRLDIRDGKAVELEDEEFFFACVKAGFTLRRKTLLNSLGTLGNIDKEAILLSLEEAGIDPKRRAESLSMQEFADLAKTLKGHINNGL